MFGVFGNCISFPAPSITYLYIVFTSIGQENVLAESRMMVPDSRKRLEAALEDLKGTLVHIFLVYVIIVYLSFLLFFLVMDSVNHIAMF